MKCQFAGCDRSPLFHRRDHVVATHCDAHREEGFVLFSHGHEPRKPRKTAKGRTSKKATATSSLRACLTEGCRKTASHGHEEKATHCVAHKGAGMTDHRHKACESVVPRPCLKQPSFGWPTDKAKRFCSRHKEPGMVNLRECHQEGCRTRSTYGKVGGRPVVCVAHREPGMVIIANKRCEKEGCQTTPRFGFLGEKPRVCRLHREEGMVNLKDRRCGVDDCMIQPAFAFPGDRPLRCSKHKDLGMVNVRHRLCHYPGCGLVPSYGDRKSKVPTYCKSHRDEGMVDLKREKKAAALRPKPGSTSGARAGEDVIAEAAGKKRPRPEHVLEPAVERRMRNIVGAIIESSERLREAMDGGAEGDVSVGEESEWENESSSADSADGDDDDSEKDDGAESDEEDDASNTISHVLSGFPPPSITEPPVARTDATRMPFHQSPLALPPGAACRSSDANTVEQPALLTPSLTAVGAERVPSLVPGTAFGGLDLPSPTATLPTTQANGGGLPGQNAKAASAQPNYAPLSLLPQVTPQALNAYALELAAFAHAPPLTAYPSMVVPPEVRVPLNQPPGACWFAQPAPRKSKAQTPKKSVSPSPSAADTVVDPTKHLAGHVRVQVPFHQSPLSFLPGAIPRGSDERAVELQALSTVATAMASTESAKTRSVPCVGNDSRGGGEGPLECVSRGLREEQEEEEDEEDISVLRWKCALCRKEVASDDQHVLACCGHGLLHKACADMFVVTPHTTFWRKRPCPKCFVFAESSFKLAL